MIASFLQMPFAASFPTDSQKWFIIALPMAVAAISIIGAFITADRSRRMRHETIRLAIEKGQPIPPSLLAGGDDGHARRKGPRNDRRTGLILLGVSGGVYLFFWGAGSKGGEWIAAIPGLIGLALLINAFIENRDVPPAA